MLARLGAAAVVLAVLVTGCGGGGGQSRSEAVGEYITQVNAVEARLQTPMKSATQASRVLTKKDSDQAAAATKLRVAAGRIDRLRVELATIETPPEAKRLRALLLELTVREAALAREVAALAAYLPAYSAALHPLTGARENLKHALAVKGAAAAKADALDAFAAAVGKTLARVRPLQPPAVVAPEHATQIATLGRIRSAAVALADALREKNAADIPRLVQSLGRALLSGQRLDAQRAQIAAVRAYNARVRGVDTLLLRIDRERSLLQKRLR